MVSVSMLLQSTLRSPCGFRVVRISLEDTWAEYLVAEYVNSVQVSAHYYETEQEAREAAAQAVKQSVAIESELMALVSL